MTIRKSLLSIVCLCCIVMCTRAQSYNNRPEFLKINGAWAMTGYSGMDFNSNPPQEFTTGMSGSVGTASVASPVTGKLLFYSDGGKIYNKNNAVMPNGTLATSTQLTNPYQGVCIVPVIDSPGKYFVFTVETPANNNSARLRYSVVDTALNGGLGDVVAGRKDVFIDSQVSNSIIAVPGDDCDVWLIAHQIDTSVFMAYNISRNGLNPVAVRSSTGPITGKSPNRIRFLENLRVGSYTYTCMAASPDRKRIAISSVSMTNTVGMQLGGAYVPNLHGIVLSDFDPATGRFGNSLCIDSSIHSNYLDLCFSPDASKLYFFSESDTSFNTYICQYDLSSSDSLTIVNSLTPIVGGFFQPFPLRLYNDTIYTGSINTHQYANGTKQYRYMARINKPNLAAAACDFEDEILTLRVENGIGYSFPNDVIIPLPRDTAYTRMPDTMFCEVFNLKLYGRSDADTYEWSTGDTDTAIDVTQQATYWVKSESYCHSYVDTFVINGVTIIPVVITVEGYTLGTMATYTTWQWYKDGEVIPGATDATYSVSENGEYSVVVTNDGGCTDSASYLISNVRVENIGANNKGVQIYPNPARDYIYIQAKQQVSFTLSGIDGKVILRQVNAKGVILTDLNKGMYFLRVYDGYGNVMHVEKIIKL